GRRSAVASSVRADGGAASRHPEPPRVRRAEPARRVAADRARRTDQGQRARRSARGDRSHAVPVLETRHREDGAEGQGAANAMKAADTGFAPALDPVAVLKGLASLRRLTGTYPAGHPSIVQKTTEILDALGKQFRESSEVRIDVIHGQVYLDGVTFDRDVQGQAPVVNELVGLGVDSVHIRDGVRPEELLAVAECLWQQERSDAGSLDAQLASRGVTSVSLGRLVPLDTKWRAQQWPDAPTGPLDPAYAESLVRAQETFEQVSNG